MSAAVWLFCVSVQILEVYVPHARGAGGGRRDHLSPFFYGDSLRGIEIQMGIPHGCTKIGSVVKKLGASGIRGPSGGGNFDSRNLVNDGLYVDFEFTDDSATYHAP
jgi:hypothetical protein